ncbi:MAG: hypothetical protein WC707_01835 [Candidatus Babeliaceae bacterium]
MKNKIFFVKNSLILLLCSSIVAAQEAETRETSYLELDPATIEYYDNKIVELQKSNTTVSQHVKELYITREKNVNNKLLQSEGLNTLSKIELLLLQPGYLVRRCKYVINNLWEASNPMRVKNNKQYAITSEINEKNSIALNDLKDFLKKFNLKADVHIVINDTFIHENIYELIAMVPNMIFAEMRLSKDFFSYSREDQEVATMYALASLKYLRYFEIDSTNKFASKYEEEYKKKQGSLFKRNLFFVGKVVYRHFFGISFPDTAYIQRNAYIEEKAQSSSFFRDMVQYKEYFADQYFARKKLEYALKIEDMLFRMSKDEKFNKEVKSHGYGMAPLKSRYEAVREIRRLLEAEQRWYAGPQGYEKYSEPAYDKAYYAWAEKNKPSTPAEWWESRD